MQEWNGKRTKEEKVMSKIIVYASRYGTSKEYAVKIAEEKGYPLCSYNEIPDSIKKYDEIIFIAPVYAGKIYALDKFIKNNNKLGELKLTFVVVGVYNPNRENNTSKLSKLVRDTLKGSNFKIQSIYHLYGKLEVDKLSFMHKMLIKALYRKAKKEPINQLSDNDRDIVEAYEQETKPDSINSDHFNQFKKVLVNL
jgi:menaquinone-dependent protoporphyrinogen IX oxidase